MFGHSILLKQFKKLHKQDAGRGLGQTAKYPKMYQWTQSLTALIREL
jgi:hypothetical protein